MVMMRVGRCFGEVHEVQSSDGHTTFLQMTMWRQTVGMRNVLCEDGKERLIYTREPDTFFTTPGYTYGYGKTVIGFVSYDSDLERHTFKAMGKHKELFLRNAQ